MADNEKLSIHIKKYNTEDSREVEERAKKYEILEPTEFEKEVVEKGTTILNGIRAKYAGKKPIPDNTIKLRVIANQDDLEELYSGISVEDEREEKTGGFVTDNGVLYIGGKYREDPLQAAHIIIHEMTHYFTGRYDTFGRYFNRENMEAATELVAMETLLKIVEPEDGVTEKDIRDNYMSYADNIEELSHIKYDEFKTDGELDLDKVKAELFTGKDYVLWDDKDNKKVGEAALKEVKW